MLDFLVVEGKKIAKSTPKAPRAPRAKPLPASLKDELERLAEEILIERTAEARKAAAFELANVLLGKVVDLLGVATSGSSRPSAASVSPPPRPTVPKIKNPCCLCGREGAWQDKTGKQGKPWYCRDHAAIALNDAKQDASSSGLFAALKNAAPIDDELLPA